MNKIKKTIKEIIFDTIKARLTQNPSLYELGFAFYNQGLVYIRYKKLKAAILENLRITTKEFKALLLEFGIKTKLHKSYMYCVIPLNSIQKQSKIPEIEVNIDEFLQVFKNTGNRARI